MPSFVRRIVFLTVLALTAAVAVPGAAGVANASTDPTIDQAPAYMLAQINAGRAGQGLKALLLDTRVQDVAQARSDDMATNHYFGHLSDDALKQMFNDRGIAWSAIGEILAENDFPTLKDSADYAMQGWRASSEHWPIITSTLFNYAGVGVAFDSSTGDWIWTVEFLRGPDRTGAKAWFTGSKVATASTGRTVKLTWSGKDVQLAALTAGLKDFKLQKATDGGAWVTVVSHTKTTSGKFTVARGHTMQFRIKARDKNGNYGASATSATFTG